MPVDISLNKAKHRTPKPKGRFRADYNGNRGDSSIKLRRVPKGMRKHPSRAARRGRKIRRYV